MLRRKAYDKLVEWKNKSDKQSLIVDGARQVGKTFIIREFAKTNYKNFYKILVFLIIINIIFFMKLIIY